MKLRGIDVDFDIARITDFRRYQEAFHAFSKTMNAVGNQKGDGGSNMRDSLVMLEALEALLVGLLGEDTAQTLLADGRIDTLMDVMRDMFQALFDVVSEQTLSIKVGFHRLTEQMAELHKKLVQTNQN
jgi:hypothetical protein